MYLYHVSELVHLEVVAVFAAESLNIMVCNEDGVLYVGSQALVFFLLGSVALSCHRKCTIKKKGYTHKVVIVFITVQLLPCGPLSSQSLTVRDSFRLFVHVERLLEIKGFKIRKMGDIVNLTIKFLSQFFDPQVEFWPPRQVGQAGIVSF